METGPEIELRYVASCPTCGVRVVLLSRDPRAIPAEAFSLGWKETAEGLICPECQSRARRR
jgi:DNA-directed RNA polymerase subunit RPC12/RpoP